MLIKRNSDSDDKKWKKKCRTRAYTGNDTPLGISLFISLLPVHPSISNAIWLKRLYSFFYIKSDSEEVCFAHNTSNTTHIHWHISPKRQIYYPPTLLASNVCTLYNLLWECAFFVFQNHTKHNSLPLLKICVCVYCVFYVFHLSSRCFASLCWYWFIHHKR